MEFDGFDWDGGNRQKCQKHDVSIEEIESLFEGAVAVSPDLRHSIAEERFKAFGRTGAGRALLVAFTFRTKGDSVLIRPVSARYMHAKEVAWYEEETSSLDD